MKIFKYLALSAILVSTINNSQAQLAVAVASNTDPTFLAMAAKSIASQGQMISQMADTVSSLQTNYQSISSSKDITSKFAAFGNMFGNMSAFMNDHVCAECTPEQLNQWAQLKVNMKKIDFSKLQPGDILLTTSHSMESWSVRFGTKSDISHAMLYVASSSVVDSTSDGVHARNLQNDQQH